jgi:hypothetical protein
MLDRQAHPNHLKVEWTCFGCLGLIEGSACQLTCCGSTFGNALRVGTSDAGHVCYPGMPQPGACMGQRWAAQAAPPGVTWK